MDFLLAFLRIVFVVKSVVKSLYLAAESKREVKIIMNDNDECS